VCLLVAGLPPDARVWRAIAPDAGWSRLEMLTAAMERRLTTLWAVVASALGQDIPSEHLLSPLDLPTRQSSSTAHEPEPGVISLRDMALQMRGS
jgi:hypothetical protein